MPSSFLPDVALNTGVLDRQSRPGQVGWAGGNQPDVAPQAVDATIPTLAQSAQQAQVPSGVTAYGTIPTAAAPKGGLIQGAAAQMVSVPRGALTALIHSLYQKAPTYDSFMARGGAVHHKHPDSDHKSPSGEKSPIARGMEAKFEKIIQDKINSMGLPPEILATVNQNLPHIYDIAKQAIQQKLGNIPLGSRAGQKEAAEQLSNPDQGMLQQIQAAMQGGQSAPGGAPQAMSPAPDMPQSAPPPQGMPQMASGGPVAGLYQPIGGPTDVYSNPQTYAPPPGISPAMWGKMKSGEGNYAQGGQVRLPIPAMPHYPHISRVQHLADGGPVMQGLQGPFGNGQGQVAQSLTNVSSPFGGQGSMPPGMASDLWNSIKSYQPQQAAAPAQTASSAQQGAAYFPMNADGQQLYDYGGVMHTLGEISLLQQMNSPSSGSSGSGGGALSYQGGAYYQSLSPAQQANFARIQADQATSSGIPDNAGG